MKANCVFRLQSPEHGVWNDSILLELCLILGPSRIIKLSDTPLVEPLHDTLAAEFLRGPLLLRDPFRAAYSISRCAKRGPGTAQRLGQFFLLWLFGPPSLSNMLVQVTRTSRLIPMSLRTIR